jgi:hypothetical protein
MSRNHSCFKKTWCPYFIVTLRNSIGRVFPGRPDMISNLSRKSRGSLAPFSMAGKNFLPKAQMCFNKMVITRGRVELGFQLTRFLRESVSTSRQSSRTLPHGQVVRFNERSIDIFAGRRGCKMFLHLFWSTKDNCCFYRHNPSFFAFLHHLSIPQFWRWNQFWFWWSTSLAGLYGYLMNNTIGIEKCSLIVAKFIAGNDAPHRLRGTSGP